MNDIPYWLIGVAVTMPAAGISMYYQGKALEKPREAKTIGKYLRKSGILWVGIAAFYLIIFLFLQG